MNISKSICPITGIETYLPLDDELDSAVECLRREIESRRHYFNKMGWV